MGGVLRESRMTLDHVAISVQSVDVAAEKLCRVLGYTRATTPVTNTRQLVNVLFLRKPGSLDLKLIEPSSPESPLWAALRKGSGLHHLCFRTDDVTAGCEALVRDGARLLAPPQPGEAFDDHLIGFCYVGFGLNVELIDTDARRGLLNGDPA